MSCSHTGRCFRARRFPLYWSRQATKHSLQAVYNRCPIPTADRLLRRHCSGMSRPHLSTNFESFSNVSTRTRFCRGDPLTTTIATNSSNTSSNRETSSSPCKKSCSKRRHKIPTSGPTCSLKPKNFGKRSLEAWWNWSARRACLVWKSATAGSVPMI